MGSSKQVVRMNLSTDCSRQRHAQNCISDSSYGSDSMSSLVETPSDGDAVQVVPLSDHEYGLDTLSQRQ